MSNKKLKTHNYEEEKYCFYSPLLISMVSFAQQERKLELNKDTNLIDVIYYHDNGVVSQTGSIH